MSKSSRFATQIASAAGLVAVLAFGIATAAVQEAGSAQGQAGHTAMHGAGDAMPAAMHHGMADMDTDKDGRLSRAEFAKAHGGKDDEFAGHDRNGDGFITQAEMDAHHAAMKAGHDAAPTAQDGESHGKDHH